MVVLAEENNVSLNKGGERAKRGRGNKNKGLNFISTSTGTFLSTVREAVKSLKPSDKKIINDLQKI